MTNSTGQNNYELDPEWVKKYGKHFNNPYPTTTTSDPERWPVKYHNKKMTQRNYPLRIIGVPRSGTLYTAKLLRSKGWDVGWERHGRVGIVSWMATVKSKWVPFGEGANDGHIYANTLAVVRDPFKTIWSIDKVCFGFRSYNGFFKFINQHISVEEKDNTLLMAADFYIKWMKIVMSKAEAIFHTNADEQLLTACWSRLPPTRDRLENHPPTDTHKVCKRYPNPTDMIKMLGHLSGDVVQIGRALNFKEYFDYETTSPDPDLRTINADA